MLHQGDHRAIIDVRCCCLFCVSAKYVQYFHVMMEVAKWIAMEKRRLLC